MMHRFDRQHWALATAVVAVLLGSSTAAAETVTLEIDDLLGGRCNERWGTLRVSVTNHGATPVSGELTGLSHAEGQHELRQRLSLEPRETASIRVDAPPNSCNYTVCFGGPSSRRSCAHVNGGWDHSRGSQSPDVLLIQENLELRPALSISGNQGRGPNRGAAIAAHGEDGETFDLPRRARGYQHLRFVVVESAISSNLSARQRRALAQWVRTGGELIFVTSSAEELLRDPLAALLAPDLTSGPGPATVVFSPDLSELFRVDETSLRDGIGAAALVRFTAPRLRAESAGARLDVGLGSVHFVVATPRADVNGASQGSQAALASQAAQPALDTLFSDDRRSLSSLWRPTLLRNVALGNLDNSYSAWDVMNEREMAAKLDLDPNQNDRLPLWVFFVIVLLTTGAFVYSQHRWTRGGRRVVGLFTPALVIAVLGCTSIFGLAYASRGVGERYRSMAWIEAGAGQRDAVIWRRLALAVDRPGAHELTRSKGLGLSAPHLITPFVTADGPDQAATIRGNRWQTILAAEHGVIDLEGAVELEWSSDLSPVAVHNGLDVDITNARLIHNSGSDSLGTLRAGERSELTRTEPTPAWEDDRLMPAQADLLERQENHLDRAALLGSVDLGCPDRGDFSGEQCTTAILIWGRP